MRRGRPVATYSQRVAASTDDAFEYGSGLSFAEWGGYLVYGDYFGIEHTGLRFTGVSGLSGSTITVATLTFTAYSSDSDAFVGAIYAQESAAPGTFDSSDYDVTDRTRTSASVAAGSAELGNWTAENEYTLDVATVIQELADSYDPSAIVLLYINSSGTGQRRSYSYGGDDAKAVKLDITYTAAGGDATLTAVLTTATALSPASTWTADATLSAVLATAYAISPAAEITGTTAGTIVASVATATALSPTSTWTADATLSAVLATAHAISPAATIFAGAVEWTAFDETQFQLTRSDFPTNAAFYLEVVMTTNSADNTVKARLYNVTDSTRVVGSDVTSRQRRYRRQLQMEYS
ncbi:MAG: hypothetical protein ACYTEX_27155 [Planctomycetota bacterium]